MDAVRFLQAAARSVVSLVLGVGVVILCGALVLVSAISLVVTAPVMLARRLWLRFAATRR